jgi:hypothetical protein
MYEMYSDYGTVILQDQYLELPGLIPFPVKFFKLPV